MPSAARLRGDLRVEPKGCEHENDPHESASTLAALAATLASCGTAAICLAAAEVEEPANLVGNSDFSQVADGKPDKWATSGSKADVTQTLSVEQDADGKPFARLVCTRCDRRGGDSHAMLIQSGQSQAGQGPRYQSPCRMRASGLRSRTAGIAIQETNGWQEGGLYERDVALGAAWKKYRCLPRRARHRADRPAADLVL